MSTRCQIGFYNGEPKDDKSLDNHQALIYRHWDGYPEAVLQDIMPELIEFNENRGLCDIEYASAWLVAKLKKDYLNIGISKDFHWDIEFYYAVFEAGVKVYSAWTEYDRINPITQKENINFKLIETILFCDYKEKACSHEWKCSKCNSLEK